MLLAEIFSPEIMLIVFGVIILLFGSSKLPQLAKGLGEARKEFKKGLQDDDVVKPGAVAAAPIPQAIPPAAVPPAVASPAPAPVSTPMPPPPSAAQ